MDIARFNFFCNKINVWNELAGNNNPGSSAQISLQEKVTLEEIDETLAAMSEIDHVETLDGIADVLVTASQLCYLHTNSVGMSEGYINVSQIDRNINYRNQLRESLLVMREHIENNSSKEITPYSLFCMIENAENHYGVDVIDDVIEEVLYSNDSKFIDIREHTPEVIEDILDVAIARYKDQFSDIVYVEKMINKARMFILRADKGEGKILKPYVYYPADIHSIAVYHGIA